MNLSALRRTAAPVIGIVFVLACLSSTSTAAQGPSREPSDPDPALAGDSSGQVGITSGDADAHRLVGARVTVKPRRPLPGQTVRVTVVIPGPSRGANLEVKASGTSYRTVDRARSRSRGATRFSTRLGRTSTVRVTADGFKSRPSRVRVRPQSGDLVIEPVIFVGESVAVEARFRPAVRGRNVALQVLTDDGWDELDQARQDGTGTAAFTLAGAEEESASVRAVALTHQGIRQVRTAPQRFDVVPAEISVADSTHVLTDDEEDTLISADETAGRLIFADSAAAPQVEVGDYLPMSPSDQLPNGGLFAVTAVIDGGDSIEVRTRPAALYEIIKNVPPGLDNFAYDTVSTTVETTSDVRASVVHGRPLAEVPVGGLRVMKAPEIRLAFEKSIEQSGKKIALTGHLHFRPGIDFGYEVRLFRPANWHLAGYAEYDLEAKLDGHVDAISRGFSLGKTTTVIGAMIGPVPVFITVESGPTLSLKASAGVGVRGTMSADGVRTVGIRRENGGFPKLYSDGDQVAKTSFTPYVDGKIELFGGFESAINAYGLAGPFFKLGYELVAEASVDAEEGFRCEIYHRPVAEWGVRTSDLIERLFDYRATDSRSWDFEKHHLHECSDDAPEILTGGLDSAVVGRTYFQQLKVTDDRSGTWSLAAGAPAWLHLDPSSGILSGTPRDADVGNRQITIRFTDSAGKTAETTLWLRVAGPPTCHDWVGSYYTEIPLGNYYEIWFENHTISNYSGTISWGNGASTATTAAGTWRHTYAQRGTYTVRITGAGTVGGTLCRDDITVTVKVY